MEPKTHLHIGIFCDYGRTLKPSAGIGVSVYNLIDGLLATESSLRLMVHDGEQRTMREYQRRWGERVRIYPSEVTWTQRASKAGLRAIVSTHGLLNSLQTTCNQAVQQLAEASFNRANSLSTRIVAQLPHQWWRIMAAALKRLLAILAFMLVATVLWISVATVYILAVLVLPTLKFPFRVLTRFVLSETLEKLAHTPPAHSVELIEQRIRDAGCDVWLVPYAATPVRFDVPNVVVTFDLVYRHVPEVFSARERTHIHELISATINRSSLIYCASEFVKENDLLPLFPSRGPAIRVFPLAPPTGSTQPRITLDFGRFRRKHNFGERFLFYPAAIRPHKNHPALVRALRILRDEYDEADLQLVCTGEAEPSSELYKLIADQRLTGRVRFLGQVSREEVAVLYRNALLVPLASLHEGWGIPLLEAMQNDCLVTCSDIPAFRERSEDSPGSIVFFNPFSPWSIARAIKTTICQRDRFLQRQREAYRRIARRTWTDVGWDYIAIFQEAIAISGQDLTGPQDFRSETTNA
jgi:glycosyltransferase involved in cell wall biosynthesis